MLVLNKYAPWMEWFFIVILFVALSLNYFSDPLPLLTSFAFTGLAFSFFLYAFGQVDVDEPESPFTTQELFAFTLLPKVMWLSAAVVALGLAFYVLNLNNDGYTHMLYTGGFPLAFGSLVILILLLLKMRQIRKISPLLLRSIPLLCGVVYILILATK